MLAVHVVLFFALFRLRNCAFLVDIITPASLTTEYFGSLRLTGPASDMAVEYLREQYGHVYQIRQNYIYDKNAKNCGDQADFMEDMLAKFFYKQKPPSNLTVVIFSGTTNIFVWSFFQTADHNTGNFLPIQVLRNFPGCADKEGVLRLTRGKKFFDSNLFSSGIFECYGQATLDLL